MENKTLRSPIRTAYLDEIYETAAKDRVEYIGASMTEEDEKAVKEIEEDVDMEEYNVMQIQNELIEYLEKRGCKCVLKYL